MPWAGLWQVSTWWISWTWDHFLLVPLSSWSSFQNCSMSLESHSAKAALFGKSSVNPQLLMVRFAFCCFEPGASLLHLAAPGSCSGSWSAHPAPSLFLCLTGFGRPQTYHTSTHCLCWMEGSIHLTQELFLIVHTLYCVFLIVYQFKHFKMKLETQLQYLRWGWSMDLYTDVIISIVFRFFSNSTGVTIT